jgi:hypothetical protein
MRRKRRFAELERPHRPRHMASDLNQMIALAQQNFRDLPSIESLQAGDLGEGAKRKHVESLLDKLSSLTVKIQGELAKHLRSADQSPIVSLPPAHAKFLREELLPNARFIQEAHLKASGQEIFLDLLKDDDNGSGLTVKNSLWFTVDYVDLKLDDDDDRRWMVGVASEVLDETWFQPDRWRENMRLLRPALVGRDESSVPTHVRVRLAEVYRTFTFGAWMATIALCRAIAEFSLINRASYLGMQATRKGADGVERYKRLDELIEIASGKHSELWESLKTLQDAGNRVLHPKKKQNVIASPHVLRAEALNCIMATVRVVEVLYAA